MNEEREIERESQLSAMFDGELPGGECELLARRLSRDEALRGQWSRYSMIGAAVRAERGVALHDRVAWRVQAAVSLEVSHGDGSEIGATNARTAAVVPAEVLRRTATRRWARFTRPLAGAGIAASVAAAAIFLLRVQGGGEQLVAQNPLDQNSTEHITLTPAVASKPAQSATLVARSAPSVARGAPSNGEPDRYSTPAPSATNNMAQNASLANYVVAHSEVSGPISRRMALLGILATENGAATQIAPDDSGAEGNDAP